MTERSSGQILVEGLRRWGVDVVFGLPGVQLDGLYEGLALEPSIRVIHTRHEQATSYMADGYARVTGRVGVCAVVPGPGVLNAAAGLATAYACGSRVLCIVGQVPTADLGRGRGVLHEIPDQHAAIKGVIGRVEYATRPEDVPALVDAVFLALLGNERPRPHALEVGWDTMLRTAAIEWPHLPDVPPPKQPDAALDAGCGRSVGARRAARHPRRRRCARRRRRPRRAGRTPGRTGDHDDRGQGRGAGQPPPGAPDARGAAAARRDRRPAGRRVAGASLARPAAGATDCRGHPRRHRPVRARPEREAFDRDRGGCRCGGRRAARSREGFESSWRRRSSRAVSRPAASSASSSGPGSPAASPISRRAASSCGPRSPRVGCSSTR